MRACWILLVACACQKDASPEFRASCKPNSALDGMECTVENVGKARGRACLTVREQPPKTAPLVARRLCTRILEPGTSQQLIPRFDRIASLQPQCSPDGTWICRDEIVETPQMLGENIPKER